MVAAECVEESGGCKCVNPLAPVKTVDTATQHSQHTEYIKRQQ